MKKIDVIFDTDIGSDCDDIHALSLLIWGQKAGLCNIKAVTYCQVSPHGVAVINSVFRYFNEEIPPIGLMPKKREMRDCYCQVLAEKFGKPEDYEVECLSAVAQMRKTLAESDGDVVICAVGPLTNIADLLNSQPDCYSDLDGVELVRQKCKSIVSMCGGRMEEEGKHIPEFNAFVEPEATRTMFEKSPVEVIVSPVELGLETLTTKELVAKYDGTDPLTLSYLQFIDGREGRPSCDPVTVLYMLLGCEDWFYLSPWGEVTVEDDGATYFAAKEGGLHRYLTQKILDGETEEQARRRVAVFMDDKVGSIMK